MATGGDRGYQLSVIGISDAANTARVLLLAKSVIRWEYAYGNSEAFAARVFETGGDGSGLEAVEIGCGAGRAGGNHAWFCIFA